MRGSSQNWKIQEQVRQPYMLYGYGNPNQPVGNQVKPPHQDLEYLQSMYPGNMKQIHEHVMRACDKMDYKNSPMYDEYPDRVMVDDICRSVCGQIQEAGLMQGNLTQVDGAVPYVEEVEIYEARRNPWGKNTWNPNPWGPNPWGPNPWGPNPWGPNPWGPPGPGRPPAPQPERPWVNDVVKVLLLNEMYRRRCRTGMCRW